MRPIPEITDAEIAFPGDVIGKYLPKEDEIPEIFRECNPKDPLAAKWSKVAHDGFYRGLKEAKWSCKQGVEINKALRVIKACLGSFQPSHEHKMAGVAFLLSEWFDDVTYIPGDDDRTSAK